MANRFLLALAARGSRSPASQIPAAVCDQINLGYRDLATIDVESFANREAEGVLLVRKAGEYLYRLKRE